MKKIKILFVVAPANADKNGNRGVNGPEKRSLNMVKYWKNYNIEPVYVYPKIGTLYNEFSKSGYKVIDFYVNGKFNFLSITTLYKIIKNNNIDIVHTQGPGSLDLFASIASKLVDRKFVFTRPIMLDDLKVSKWKKAIFKLFDKITVRLTNNIIAVSSNGEYRLKKQYPKYQYKVIKIFNGIRFDNIKKQNVNQNNFVISMCAQLTENKGWFDFIEVIDNLKSKIINLKAFIIGNGPLYGEIKEKIEEKNLEDTIIMTGHTNDVSSYLEQTDLYIMTSYREGLSVAVIEAMAHSLPLVLYNFAGSNDQVENGKNGFIVNTGNIEEFISKILYIYNNDLCNEYGNYSFQIFKNKFLEEKMVENYVNVYKGLIKDV